MTADHPSHAERRLPAHPCTGPWAVCDSCGAARVLREQAHCAGCGPGVPCELLYPRCCLDQVAPIVRPDKGRRYVVVTRCACGLENTFFAADIPRHRVLWCPACRIAAEPLRA